MPDPWTPVAPAAPDGWALYGGHLLTEDGTSIITDSGLYILLEYFPVGSWAPVSGSNPCWTPQ